MEAWRSQAKCRRRGPLDSIMENGESRCMTDREWGDFVAAVFFPRRGESILPGQAICNECPVKAECLAYGTDINNEIHGKPLHGIWGGEASNTRGKSYYEEKYGKPR